MRRITVLGATAATAAAGGVAAAIEAVRRRGSLPVPEGRGAEQRWHVVTVNRKLDEVADAVPDPLLALGDAVEVRTGPAPGGRGTELAARVRPDHHDGDRDGDAASTVKALRAALRDSKQLIETGEVLLPDGPPTTRTTATNRPLQAVTEHAKEEGRL